MPDDTVDISGAVEVPPMIADHAPIEKVEVRIDPRDIACIACGRREPEVTLEPDHVRPLHPRDGGPPGKNDIDNIQPLCGPCNRRKSNREIDYR